LRLQVRYTDAHRGFVPTARVRTRVVLPDDLTRGPIESKREHEYDRPLPHTPYKSHEYDQSHSEPIVPYDWNERKAGVMARMPNVLNWVQPIGSTTPYNMLKTDGDEARELAWLIKTQHMDLAPQWQEFAANGLRASSRHNAEEGSLEADIEEEELELSVALAEVYTTGRREQWAMERDNQTWHTSPVRRVDVKETTFNRYSAKSRWGSEHTREELLACIDHRRIADWASVPDDITYQWQGCLDYMNALDRDDKRDAFRIADEQERYDVDRVGYASGVPCPMRPIILESVPMCQNGADVPFGTDGKWVAPVFAEDAAGLFVEEYVPCQTCFGSGQVQMVLGAVIAAVDTDEAYT
jgi:hypothetical protein